MSNLELRTEELNKMISKLRLFSEKLRDEISFKQGQRDLVKDMIKQMEETVVCIQEEEQSLSEEKERRKKDAENLRGVKTPKGRRKNTDG